MLLGVDVALRFVPAGKLIAYERGVPGRYAVREHLRAFGSPEVLFVGSSRVHVGVVVPVVKESLEAELGRSVHASNFANGGVLLPEIGPMLEQMLRKKPLPKVLVIGMDPEQIARDEMFNDRTPIFWTFADWNAARQRFGNKVIPLLPETFRTWHSGVSVTFRSRLRPVHLIKELGRGREGTAITGEYVSPEHTKNKAKSLADKPADELNVEEHVKKVHLKPDGTYPFNAAKVAWWQDLATRCEQAGVEVVFAEFPNAEVFEKFLPPTTLPEFRSTMRSVAAASGAEFYSNDDLGMVYADADFGDPVHLNLAGGTRLSRALAQGPVLAAIRRAEQRGK